MLLDFLLDLIILNIFLHASMKHTIVGIDEMNQQFRTFVVLAWNLGVIPSIHKTALDHL